MLDGHGFMHRQLQFESGFAQSFIAAFVRNLIRSLCIFKQRMNG